MAGSTKKITKVTLEHMDWEQVDVNLRETQDFDGSEQAWSHYLAEWTQ